MHVDQYGIERQGGLHAVEDLVAIDVGDGHLGRGYQEEIVRKVDETVGIGKQVKQHCGALETRFQREWDDAVNNDTIDRREAELSAMRREIDQLCNAK